VRRAIVLGLSLLLATAGAAESAPSTSVPVRQLVGQSIMTAFTGLTVDQALLRRIRLGQVGGLIVFGANYRSDRQLRQAIAQAQAAARAGHQPPLLIAADQEGGLVRRIPTAPPVQSAALLARLGTGGVRTQGALAGRALRAIGINLDLAPVLDTPSSPSNFLGSRAFSSDPATAARLGSAFIGGLQSARVAATGKHFPGLGTATGNTDNGRITITTSAAELARRLAPFRAAVGAGTRLVMVSSAIYTAYDPTRPAVLSSRIVSGLLRNQLHFDGVVISDSFESPAIVANTAPAAKALKAGTDVILYTSERDAANFARLAAEAQADPALRASLTASYRRILALKAWLSGR
jgi:beta-N-acetylhexosaminidase